MSDNALAMKNGKTIELASTGKDSASPKIVLQESNNAQAAGRPESSGQIYAGNRQDVSGGVVDLDDQENYSPGGQVNTERDLVGDQDTHRQGEMEFSDSLKKLKGDKPVGMSLKMRIQHEYCGVFDYHRNQKEDQEDPEPYLYSKTSLFCLTDQNKLRQGLVWLATWSWFEHIITLAIVLNSLLLASTDYEPRLNPAHVSTWTPIQEQIDLVFNIIFIFECAVKVMAMGFIFHKFSYIRDAWNKLDFFIVVISIVSMLPISGGSDSLKALRTFRILRPLRSINKMPMMRQQIQSLLASIPGLMRVFFFIIFIFTIFAIFGTNQFMGQQYQFCRNTEDAERDPLTNDFIRWEKSGEDSGDGPVLCREDAQCKYSFPDDEFAICGTVWEKFQLDPIEHDGIRDIELIMYGIPGFDSVGQGFLTIFQILTLESWVYLMYNFSDAGSPLISVIFFVMVVLLGAFFTMNLVLAIIVDSFDKYKLESEGDVKEESIPEDEQKEKDEEEVVDKAIDAIKILDGNLESEPPLDGPRNYGVDGQGNLLPSIASNPNIAQQAARISQAEIAVAAGRNLNSLESESGPGTDGNLQLVSPRATAPRNPLESAGSPSEGGQSMPTEPKVIDIGIIEALYDYEEEDYEKKARKRAELNGCYRCAFNLVTSVSFNFFIFMLIIGNTATLAAYSYDQSDLQTQVLEFFNEFFTWIFLLELITKLIGLGFENYSKDSYNLFDATIVIISLIDWTISRIPNLDAGSALNAFRALRLLRMLKLSKSWKALAEILRKTGESLKAIGNFSLLLILFMYIFALLGMELFANVALVDEDDNLIAGVDNIQELYASGDYFAYPRDNFNNVGYALTTIFIVILGEDWNWSMYQWVRAYGYGSAVSYYIAVFFFLLLMIMGNIVLFSLFTAILLENFEGGDEDEEEEEDDALEDGVKKPMFSKECCSKISEAFKEAFGKKKRVNKILNAQGDAIDVDAAAQLAEKQDENANLHPFGSDASMNISNALEDNSVQLISKARRLRTKRMMYSPLIHYSPKESMLARTSTIKTPQDQIKLKPLMSTSLFCMGPDNCLRNAMNRFVENWWFEKIILTLIIISTITLALETPLDDPQGEKIQILEKIDLFMTATFTFEMCVKIGAKGFAFAGKDSYIRLAWNVLDFLIVCSALLGLVAGDAIDVGFLKALRILKVLRPLRLIAKHKGLKIAIVSLGRSIPNIVRLQVIVLFFVFLFAILQTTLFSGSFYACNTDHLNLSMKQQKQNIETMWDCINYGGEWMTPDLNFDTTLNSLLTLITIQTTEGWIDVMWASVDAVGPYQQPQENASPVIILYTMILVIIICMLFIELFVGVVIETFNTQKEIMQGNRDLMRSQLSYARVHMLIMEVKPMKRLEAQYSMLRNAMIHLTEHSYFDTFIMVCILANTFVLGFVWYMQSQDILDVLNVFNYAFMIIFTIEAVLKIIAQLEHYFTDSWNLFDFTVVAMTIVILGITWAGIGKDLEILGTILRTLRIGRVFRLIKKQEKLQAIFKTLIDATPSMASLGLLLMLLIFMFSIIGIAQFALTDLNGASEMNQHVNFQSFGAAFLTLIRCSTGEAWNSIMLDSAQSFSIMYQCEANESFETMIAQGRDPNEPFDTRGCGTGFAIAFHLLFQVIVSQVFLNLFIAIIIDAFFGQTDMDAMPVKLKSFEDFQRLWSMYDKDATGFITVSQLDTLLIDLAKSDPTEGGSLIPFKKRMADDGTVGKQFRNRQIIALDIPTHKLMKNVMFYDVLIKLSYQAVKLHFQKEDVRNMQRQLTVLKKLGGPAFNDDTLEALSNKNVNKNHFDRAIKQLFQKFEEKVQTIEIVQELMIVRKNMQKEYNHVVDTNQKVIKNKQTEEDQAKMLEMGSQVEIELYTTTHLGSTHRIHDFIVEYLKRMKDKSGNAPISRQNSDAMRAIAEVSSHQENTGQQRSEIENAASPPANAVAAAAVIPSHRGQPESGVVELEPDAEHDESSAVQDQDWRNLR